MKFYNLKDTTQVVDYAAAVRIGLGRNQGLFFPQKIIPLANIEKLLNASPTERYFELLQPFVSENINDNALIDIIEQTFTFPAKLVSVSESSHCLELFHGPTLAFKDFGANFMANCLQYFASEKPITILTATSGDTGAAVAHAFHHRKNIRVVILFPQGKISALQQKMFTTLGDNIHTLAIDGNFDDCQALVKQCFDHPELVAAVGLNSANSINISRLLAQICYYFDAFAQLGNINHAQINHSQINHSQVVVSVPCGNFGNLCAGIIAKTLGLPIKRFIAATNVNDTVPRYLQSGRWSPQPTIATISNAMDVSQPNNWPRIEYLMTSGQFNQTELIGCAVNEAQTENALKNLYRSGYLSEPHAAVAYHALRQSLSNNETGIFLGTAHPAKFKSSVEAILSHTLALPHALLACKDKTDLAIPLAANFKQLSRFLYQLSVRVS